MVCADALTDSDPCVAAFRSVRVRSVSVVVAETTVLLPDAVANRVAVVVPVQDMCVGEGRNVIVVVAERPVAVSVCPVIDHLMEVVHEVDPVRTCDPLVTEPLLFLEKETVGTRPLAEAVSERDETPRLSDREVDTEPVTSFDPIEQDALCERESLPDADNISAERETVGEALAATLGSSPVKRMQSSPLNTA